MPGGGAGATPDVGAAAAARGQPRRTGGPAAAGAGELPARDRAGRPAAARPAARDAAAVRIRTPDQGQLAASGGLDARRGAGSAGRKPAARQRKQQLPQSDANRGTNNTPRDTTRG